MRYETPISSTYSRASLVGPRTEGVLSRRLLAYLVDLVVIGLLILLFGILIAVAGVVTFGLGWALYVVLVPGAAILYSAITVGGAGTGTFGMRLLGLSAVDSATGRPVGILIAGLHALLFYVGIGTLLLLVLDVVIGLARSDRRLGHDLLSGLIVVRR
ncbi:RDD family protein [Enterovirga sp.]|jgi:uncharacterized RDD family membrane protein YckC|uniref:RDD family protein n=1 Tax=Enterovirga sp. TaxID=2026350 RepID=UPI00261CF96C|nr:RDD family protein [Enterovirga sp.]MDB5589982.1 domain containing protein [Enterovirga sp.]